MMIISCGLVRNIWSTRETAVITRNNDIYNFYFYYFVIVLSVDHHHQCVSAGPGWTTSSSRGC